MPYPPESGPSPDAEPDTNDASEPSEQEQEPTSVYLTRSQLGGKQCKVGDMLNLKVTDIDPQTGEVEATMSGDSYGSGDSEDSHHMQAFDQAMS